MTKKITIVLLCLFASAQLAIGQKYAPGYYIKTRSDTTRGEIFIQRNSGNIIGIKVKKNETFKPIELEGAGTSDLNLVSKILTVDKSPKFTEPVIDTVFLEVLIRGKESLLFFIDEFEKSHYYIEKQDGSLEELGLKILDLGSGLHFQQLTTYKDVLKKNYPNCQELFPEIDKTSYSKSKIELIFRKIHKCAFGELSEQTVKKETVVETGVLAGISLTQIKFTNIDGSKTGIALYDFDKATNITGGFFLDLRFARLGKLFTLRNELIYRSYTTSSPETANIGSTAYVSASYLKYNLVLRHTFSYGKVRPFLNVGMSGASLLSHSDHITIRTGSPTTPTLERPLLGSVNSFDFGLSGGAGIIAGKFGLEARAEYSFGLQPEKAYTSPVNTFYFLTSYRLTSSGN